MKCQTLFSLKNMVNKTHQNDVICSDGLHFKVNNPLSAKQNL